MTLPRPLPLPVPIPLEDEPVSASADGIVLCLRLLAEESLSLNLLRTRIAIHNAVTIAMAEKTTRSTIAARLLLH